MLRVELIYDPDCPNVERARYALRKALGQVELAPMWREWNLRSPETPAHARGYGSPTILVDGRDVAGFDPHSDGTCCRLYRHGLGQLEGAPSPGQIREALSAGKHTAEVGARSSSGWRSSLAAVPGIGVALLPKLACPACWPAYAALLGSLGLGFLLDARYLFAFTAVFLSLAFGALAFRAPTRRGYGPFALGLAAAAAVLVGRFVVDSKAAMYGGLGLLIAASAWNAWPRKKVAGGSCPQCVGQALEVETKVTTVKEA